MRNGVALVTSAAWFLLTAGVGAVLIPWWLTGWQVQSPPALPGPTRGIGAALIFLGLVPPVHVFAQFVRAGGTPMPGAMTTRLVVSGFNAYVRNPIYLGAVTIFVGEALLLWQGILLGYAVAAWVAIAAFVRWYEEPALLRRFGSDYEAYRQAVRSWIPRRHPWVARAHTQDR